jgi:hypothetical protein
MIVITANCNLLYSPFFRNYGVVSASTLILLQTKLIVLILHCTAI